MRRKAGRTGILVSILVSTGFFSFCQEYSSLPEKKADLLKIKDSLSEDSSSDRSSDKKITLNLRGIDIIELFRILSLKTGYSIVPSKQVKGRLNLFLNNVSFEDVLDIILVSQGLAYEKKGNIIYVMTASEYKEMYGQDYIERRKFATFKLKYAKPANVFNVLSNIKSSVGKVIVDEASGTVIVLDIPQNIELMEKALKQLDRPLKTEIFKLNYAQPKEVENQLSKVITPGVGGVIVDGRSSTAVVYDLPQKMTHLEKILRALDEEDYQVFIEAEIIQLTFKDNYYQGINWEKVFHGADELDFAGSFPVTQSISSYQQISVGTFSEDNYMAVMNFLEEFGDVKVISRPRIAVVNNQEAKIMIGSREAFISSTSSQGQTTTITSENVEFVDVGVKLSVTPTINKEGFITMRIKPEISSVRETIETEAGSVVPIVETSEAETVVKVKDGKMIMIAGLIKHEKRKERERVPFLGRLPVIGNLFSSRTKENKRTELIVFITPRLMKGDKALVGTEPETQFPEELVSEELTRKMFLKEIEKIGQQPSSELLEKDFRRHLKGIKELKAGK